MINQVFHFIIRVSKSDSAFVYFQLEANEGLCFYSTLDHEEGQVYRDLDIRGASEFQDEVTRLLEFLGQSINVQWLKQ